MKQDDYGEKYQDHLMDQYKLYVEMADRVSQRRDHSNRFYSALLTGLLAVILVVAKLTGWETSVHFPAVVLLAVALVGLAICTIWFINVRSYRQLNSAKFKIVHEIEEQLPFPCYRKEWNILRPETGKKRYLQITRIEQFVPLVLSIPYLVLVGYSLFIWISR